LNSNYLLHQALQLMQDVSPEYLDRFTAQVDALLWLGQLGSDGPSPARPEPSKPIRGGARAKIRA
jgi:hypothetical protein